MCVQHAQLVLTVEGGGGWRWGGPGIFFRRYNDLYHTDFIHVTILRVCLNILAAQLKEDIYDS